MILTVIEKSTLHGGRIDDWRGDSADSEGRSFRLVLLLASLDELLVQVSVRPPKNFGESLETIRPAFIGQLGVFFYIGPFGIPSRPAVVLNTDWKIVRPDLQIFFDFS